MANKLPHNAFFAPWVRVIFLLALAMTAGAPVAAQGCEDCRELKEGLRGVTPGKLTAGAGGTPTAPVVRVVLFWVEGCGHCEEVLDGIFPQEQQRYGPQLEVRLVEVVTTEDIAAFYDVAEMYGFARGRAAVPFLLIGKQALSGEDQISAELSGLIEGYLAKAGWIGQPSPQGPLPDSRLPFQPTAAILPRRVPMEPLPSQLCPPVARRPAWLTSCPAQASRERPRPSG